jgi:hypothetical protein
MGLVDRLEREIAEKRLAVGRARVDVGDHAVGVERAGVKVGRERQLVRAVKKLALIAFGVDIGYPQCALGGAPSWTQRHLIRGL